MNHEAMLQKVTDHLKGLAKTETVIGTQFQLGEFTCVPVMKIGMGFGSGGGSGSSKTTGSGSGGGAGAGIGMQPMGFLVTRGDEIAMVTANQSKGLSAMFEKLPDVLEKYIDQQAKEEKEEKTEPAKAE